MSEQHRRYVHQPSSLCQCGPPSPARTLQVVEPYVEEHPFTEPVAAFAPFAADPFALLLDSALADASVGRYAFIAADPFLVLRAKNESTTLGHRVVDGHPFAALRDVLARFPQSSIPGLPPFQGGAAGYAGYDLCVHLERLPAPALDDMAFPDMAFGLYDLVVAFDLEERCSWIISSGYPEQEPRAPQTRRGAGRRPTR
jgi:para-aminobenzoate synthetase component 1